MDFEFCIDRLSPSITDVKEHITRNLPQYLQNVLKKYASILQQSNNNQLLGPGLGVSRIGRCYYKNISKKYIKTVANYFEYVASLMIEHLFAHDPQPPQEFGDIPDLQDAYQ